MNFRSEAPSCASRPIEAMVWINQIESAKFLADPKTSYATTRARLQTNFEVLGSEKASGFKMIINGDFKRRVIIQEEAAQKEKRFLTERQVAWMIYEYFKVSDRNKSVLGLHEILRNHDGDEEPAIRGNTG